MKTPSLLLCPKIQRIDPVDPLIWLESQSLFPKIYWKERSGKTTYAAVGSVLELNEIPDFTKDEYSNLRFFGGMSFFSKNSDRIWNNFPDYKFILPEFVLKITQDETLLIQYGERDLPPAQFRSPLQFPQNYKRDDSPSYDIWCEKISGLLEKIQSQELEKVVMGRKTTLTFDQHISPLKLLPHLSKETQTLFAFQISEDEAFIGATPEKLYERKGLSIASDALAGTRPKGQNRKEEEKFAEELLQADKELREFGFVKDFLFSALESKCDTLHWESPLSIKSSSTVQHLYQKLLGTLKSEVTDKELIDLLHPTPALGGKPRAGALEHLMKEEPFSRGWYGAPIGWVEKDSADIAVGIRSALIQKNSMHLFAAAGIVKGSDPKQEWEEIEHKISNYLRIFS